MDALEAARVLFAEFDKAYAAARDLRDQVSAGFVACAAGRGPGPNDELIKECDEAEALAERLKAEVASALKL